MDDDTGIEFFEKNLRERVKQWIREGEDSRLWGITFVFRDPDWTAANGSHEVEFPATSRSRKVETKDRTTARVYRTDRIYGFDIPTREFDQKFDEYTNGSAAKLDEVRNFVRAAVLHYLGKKEDKVVNFT
jgi:hypothetical protein